MTIPVYSVWLAEWLGGRADMTRVYAEGINGKDGALTPKTIKVSNNERQGNWPSVMPLPRWEPTWLLVELMDRNLDKGDGVVHDSGASTWRDEPRGDNLTHIMAHVVQAVDAASNFDVDLDMEAQANFVEHMVHAATRLAMELANLRRRMETISKASPDQLSL